MATQKELFVIQALEIAQALADAGLEQTPALSAQWTSLGFQSGGGDEIIDADLTRFNGLTASDLQSFMTSLAQLENYFNNTAVSTANRVGIYNSLKYVNFS